MRGVSATTADLPDLCCGLQGEAGTGAAAALVAAAARPDAVLAVLSRGGRPDLAGPAMVEVAAPTLLIVGERDTQVLDHMSRPATRCGCPRSGGSSPPPRICSRSLAHWSRVQGRWAGGSVTTSPRPQDSGEPERKDDLRES